MYINKNDKMLHDLGYNYSKNWRI